MTESNTRKVVERFIALAWTPEPMGDLSEVCHADFVEEWPQSGERIRGIENHRLIHSNYPQIRDIKGEMVRIAGSEDRWVTTPSYTVLKVEGTGDVYTAVVTATYPGEETSYIVSLFDLKEGKIKKMTTFFAAKFEAPGWRAQWVEKI